MAPMARTNPTQPVHAHVAKSYLKSARKLSRLRAPAAGLHALEHAVAAAEHAQYSGDVHLLDEAVGLASQLQSRVLADMGSDREMLAVPILWTNPKAKVPDREDEEAIVELVSQTQAGNQEAFGALYSLYYDRVYQIALNCVRAGRKGWSIGDQQNAKDLTQNAFLTALEKISSFQGKSKFYTWLYRIVTNNCKQWSRRLGRFAKSVRPTAKIQEEIAGISPGIATGTAGYSLGARRIARAVAAAMDSLSEKNRELVRLADMEKMSAAKIMEVVGGFADRQLVADALTKARTKLQKDIHERLGADVSVTPEKLMTMSPPEQKEAMEDLKAEAELLAEESKKMDVAIKALEEAKKRAGGGPGQNPHKRARSALRRRLGLS